MKLELKHLAPYLPYSVTYTQENARIKAVLTSDVIARREKLRTIEDVRLILRPLSDLTKEIDHNGEKFVPKDVFMESDVDLTSYDGVVTLCSWHFDVFGLIEKGLAIDINTLPK
jgi:hypothetical protein